MAWCPSASPRSCGLWRRTGEPVDFGQCLSLLIVYFFGDLVLRGLAFDWIVGAAAIVVALSVQVFTLAGQRRKEASG